MRPYIVATLLAMIAARMSDRENNRLAAERKNAPQSRYYVLQTDNSMQVKAFMVLSAIPFIVITGLRYRVGTDYMYYVQSFHAVSYGGNSYFNNPLYIATEYLGKWLMDDYALMFTIHGLIMTACYWVGIYQLSWAPWYSILMFVLTNTYFVSLNGVRQGLAMAVLFLSLIYVYREDFKRYAVAVAAACLFHKGVIVFAPFYFLAKKKLSPFAAWAGVAFCTVAALVIPGPIRTVIGWFGYSGYLTGSFGAEGFETILALINLAILAVFSFYDSKARESEFAKQYNILFWMQTLASCSIMMSTNVPLAKRLCWIFSIGQILSLPLFTRLEDSRVGKVVINGGIIGLFALSIYIGIVRNGSHGVYPYNWVWTRLSK